MAKRTPATVTLLELLCDGFEKNEVWDGFFMRTLPLHDEATAVGRFESFVAEATAWKGPPLGTLNDNGRRRAQWDDLDIRQAGRGVLVRAKSGRFTDWWHADETWADQPMDSIYAWLADEQGRQRVKK
ncbi:MAG TPA: hypothetical protein VGM90_33215 [Kofleriaceae bacterium]|jgi:hypothetical protein